MHGCDVVLPLCRWNHSEKGTRPATGQMDRSTAMNGCSIRKNKQEREKRAGESLHLKDLHEKTDRLSRMKERNRPAVMNLH